MPFMATTECKHLQHARHWFSNSIEYEETNTKKKKNHENECQI